MGNPAVLALLLTLLGCSSAEVMHNVEGHDTLRVKCRACIDLTIFKSDKIESDKTVMDNDVATEKDTE